MTTDQQQQTITPERQIAAQQVGAVFASLHRYLDSLKLVDDNGQLLMTEQLRNAHARVEESGFWAVKHVLTFGVPAKAPPAAPAEPSPADGVTTPGDVN
jgi:hypothetical protein